jgi:hypothetical protein
LFTFLLISLTSLADTDNLSTDFQNYWLSPSPANGSWSNYYGTWPDTALTNASTPVYLGHALGNTNATPPAGGGYLLLQSAFGQPVEGIQPDYDLGATVTPPPGADTNVPPANFAPVQAGDNTAAYYECTDPQGGAFWVPSTKQVIAAQPNNVEIHWIMTNGTTNVQVFMIGAVPYKRPARLFWTESPYDAPRISLQGLFPVIHYNSEVRPPVYNITTNVNGGITNITSNVVSGVWLDEQKELHAINESGLFILEYYEEGSYSDQVQPAGMEIVQVLEPEIVTLDAKVGERLLPQDTYWGQLYGINGLIPLVQAGLNDSVYVNSQSGPKQNWAFAIRNTIDDPWSLEIYWEHTGAMGVQWPYEVDWYSCDWPLDPQKYVIAESTQYQAQVLIPDGLTATLMPDMDPDNHAHLSDSGKSFYTVQPGKCLLQYTTQDDVWFEVVQSVYHDDPAYSNLDTNQWTIGDELRPPAQDAHALDFDGSNDFIRISENWLSKQAAWSLSLWFNADSLTNGTLYSAGSPSRTFSISFTTNETLLVEAYNSSDSTDWSTAESAPLSSFIIHNSSFFPSWHYLAATLSGGSNTGGVFTLALDNQTVIVSSNFHLVAPQPGENGKQTTFGASAPSSTNASGFFNGLMDQVRVWNTAVSLDDLWNSRHDTTSTASNSLVADYPFDAGEGDILYSALSGKNGTLYGNPRWTYGQVEPDTDYAEFPGYIYTPFGTPYNVNRYNYPTESDPDAASYVFGVNTGLLEVWWANRSRQDGMPAVYYPSYVARYTLDWPTGTPEIVMASGLGSGDTPLSDGSIYFQNDAAQPGYNPNEEHALMLSDTAYALRNDLNTAHSSEPFVLVDYLNATNQRPEMQLFLVVQTNAQYGFEYSAEAGGPIEPPMPLAAMPGCDSSYSDTTPPAWRDRKNEWWAVAAGDDGGNTQASMHFYYWMQPTFWFPGVASNQQPAAGTEIPWLPNPAQSFGMQGPPQPILYDITWPDNIPEIRIGQTLTAAAEGLPDVWDQLSIEIPYQQSQRNGNGTCAQVFDPVVAHGAPLAQNTVQKMIDADLAQHDSTDAYVRFPALSPSLYQRIYYDPNRGSDGELMLEGIRIAPLTGDAYLLLNALSAAEQSAARAIADGQDFATEWATAVNALSNAVTSIQPNVPYVNAALYAMEGRGTGYVTLAFNNSTNILQVPPALPVSLSIIRVVPDLYPGDLEVIEPENVLDETLSLRISPDYAGEIDDFIFQWRWAEPVGGLPPNTNFATWSVYGADNQKGNNQVTLSGASPFTIADHYFAVRYRAANTNNITGTAWSEWTDNLAPGWVTRVMDGINPFEQCFQDKVDNAVDTRSTMIQMAGPPYEGDVALNEQAACEGGLIPLYQTVLNRAAAFSIDAGIKDSDNNQTLLFAASRLHDLYMLLGNEAYADALNSTIAFPNTLYRDQFGGEATSLFCFMNQLPNLLEEELALLRGRDNTLEPSVETSPVYNRLIWNFTAGINGGEPAYAYNYNILGAPTSTVGVISATDAKALYPQGHGDAWGHYLSALTPYLTLLANTNFVWQTEPGATLVGNADVSTDFFDEQKFAEAAAARARAGVETLQRTFRDDYHEDTTAWHSYRDSNTNRAWGVPGWGARAGQGAYLDWALANSLLLDRLTNMTQVGGSDLPPEGIQKIDRTTVPELSEIAAALQSIQTELDQVDGNLNPLGLARDVVPFDISPTGIDAGQTHFEQIYDRALEALRNACRAYDYSRHVDLQMRAQFDSVYNLRTQLAENETDFHNRLIGIYGYPYADDIGPTGTYPQGYQGPDLINWQIIELGSLVGNVPTGQPVSVEVLNYNFVISNDLSGTEYADYENLSGESYWTTNVLGTATVYVADNGLRVKPPTWTGRRAAEGELQLALADYVRTWYELDAAIDRFNQELAILETDLAHQLATDNRLYKEWSNTDKNLDRQAATSRALEGLKLTAQYLDLVRNTKWNAKKVAAKQIPGMIIGAAGISSPVELNTLQTIAATVEAAATTEAIIQSFMVNAIKAAITGQKGTQDRWNIDLKQLLADDKFHSLIKWGNKETLDKLEEQYVRQAELMAKVESLNQMQQRVNKLVAQGELLQAQRGQVRARAAQRIQMDRYGDLAFRIFRDDALRRYDQTFALAARYTYLAAKAYDYETGLLLSDADTTPGQQFLEEITRARLPGRFDEWLGQPLIGSSEGEPGLADILARMKADWDVIKSRFGFNNPDTETSRFSLRTELFRTAPDSTGDATWAQTLENCRVDDLNQLDEFTRHCIPFTSSTNVEPGLVIPFSTTIEAGKNFFGHDLAGGDNAYSPARAATKVRSLGIWFTGYDTTFSTNEPSAGGLANQPYVYLIPVGRDIMRSPTREADTTRSWQIFDQAMPLPYDIGDSQLNDPDWQPFIDSTEEPLAKARRFAAFRAYHDSGEFVEAETHNSGRLIGRSVWNTRWLLIIPGRALLEDPDQGIERFIYGPKVNGTYSGDGIKDIKLFFQTYGVWGE